MSQKNQLVLTFVFGVIVGLLAWNIIVLSEPTPVMAQAAAGGTNGSANGYIAVTGAVSNAFSGLWIIKTNETDHSPSLALYIPEREGNRIKFTAARRIKHDFKIVRLNDRSQLSPNRVERELEKINKKNK
ncbi:hypothetical protein [Candidatus Uabimicrobium amorphum]|uniref:Uncharacterized protein n=1 Tax=Uabimicrobium amorphum TaxID=2596890 RepID=A0A5S9F7E8_UABAM|nr:hypothetical protein [Candidatus Uabimicrobium amorphum]BBM87574.1 hypothetical protein UABAM_05986 [Candidatus Uabimicrobium amorphum]